MKISVKGKEADFREGILLSEVFTALWPEEASDFLGGSADGQVIELNMPVTQPCDIFPLSYKNEEGRRMTERSVRFVFLLACQRLFPTCHARILNSIGYGVYLKLREKQLTAREVALLEAEMRRIVAADLPFQAESWAKEKAVDYFARFGQEDTADLMRYCAGDTLTVRRLDTLYEHFYGALLPSSGLCGHFTLRQHYPGLVIQLPSPQNPQKPCAFVSRPKHLAAFGQSQHWCEILNVDNAADVNRRIENGTLKELIRVNEALQDKSIAQIADNVAKKKARIVLMSGPSSSGKTTFANRLNVHLQVLGLHPILLSMDDFYRDRSTLPLLPDGTVDLETADALDLPCLNHCLEQLWMGQEAQLPHFDFHTQKRTGYTPLKLAEGQPLLMEGIHGLNPRVTSQLPPEMMYRIFVTALSSLNLDDHNRIRTTDWRLLRRIVRDYQFRSAPAQHTLAMWGSVRAGEEKWIFPFQEEADEVFNSAFTYELPFLKTIALPLLQAIPKDDPTQVAASRLMEILSCFLSAPESALPELPPLSLAREFLGGCSFYG